MIERYNAPGGHEVTGDLLQTLGEMLTRNVVIMDPGTYDVTPPELATSGVTRELVIEDNGNAQLRALPKTPNTVIATLDPTAPGGARQITLKPGGSTSFLDSQKGHKFALVTGGHPSKPGLHVFDLFVWEPGAYQSGNTSPTN